MKIYLLSAFLCFVCIQSFGQIDRYDQMAHFIKDKMNACHFSAIYAKFTPELRKRISMPEFHKICTEFVQTAGKIKAFDNFAKWMYSLQCEKKDMIMWLNVNVVNGEIMELKFKSNTEK
ncbi:MAG: hypothetical protein MUC49_21865 [Raineya sp.]|jgi:hypothetical protein|nr:hypothetical protein [Raineya sp.]